MTKTVIITGGTGAMGRCVVKAMLENGYKVIMTYRNTTKCEIIYNELLKQFPRASLRKEYLDLASFSSIRSFVDRMSGEKIDALFNNAGTMQRHKELSPDGFEKTLATNYLGPFLLTNLLLPLISENGVIVNMVSLSCYFTNLRKGLFDRRFSQLGSYSQSKLALYQFSLSLSESCTQKVYLSDPGIVNSEMIRLHRWFDPLTDILFRPFCNSPQKGARSAINALLQGLNEDTKSDSRIFFVGKIRRKPSKCIVLPKETRTILYSQTSTLLGL